MLITKVAIHFIENREKRRRRGKNPFSFSSKKDKGNLYYMYWFGDPPALHKLDTYKLLPKKLKRAGSIIFRKDWNTTPSYPKAYPLS